MSSPAPRNPPRKQHQKRRVEGGRVTPRGGAAAPGAGGTASRRYTPPDPHLQDRPSPLWVPVLMFTLFGLGLVVIFLNYVGWLPGATDNLYTLLGLALVLGGLVTATQYR